MPYFADPAPFTKEAQEHEALRADIEAADAASACRVQGPDSPIDFWHSVLPEVIAAESFLTSQDVHTKVLSIPRRRTGAVIGGHVATWGHFPRKLSTLVLFVSLLLPAASQAQEPCKVNVATCKAVECAYLPGIGPSKGAAIEAAHPKTEADLDAVPGIGAATLAKIRPHVVYSGPTTCTSKQAAQKATGKDGAK